jgi:hypothetical protein
LRVAEEISASNVMVDADLSAAQTAAIGKDAQTVVVGLPAHLGQADRRWPHFPLRSFDVKRIARAK